MQPEAGASGENVCAVAAYGALNASTRVRSEEWLCRLAPAAQRLYYVHGVDNRLSTLARHVPRVAAAELDLRTSVLSSEILFLQREASPLSRGTVEQRLMRRASRSVYDIDDALHLDVNGSSLRRFFRTPTKYVELVRSADVVIAGNDPLADWANEHCRSVIMIPTCVEPKDYEQKVDYRISDPPRIGWIGSFSGVQELASFAGPLRRLHERTGATLEILATGDPSPPELAAFSTSIQWTEDEAVHRLCSWDVGIMPLLDEPFNHGKSAYKLLQYAAVGLPAVASPIGVNRSVLAALGMPGPENDDEMFDALLRLVTTTTAERARLGQRARTVAESAYSYAAWANTWRDAVLR